MKQKNILVVSQAKVGQTETFIRLHMEKLKGNIFHLYGYYLNYYENDISLSRKYSEKKVAGRLLNLLPHYFVFRINKKRKKKYSDFNLISRYLKENNIDVVLAEYGTTGAFIAPVCRALNIPLIVHFHGFDASRTDIITKFKEQYLFMFNYALKIIAVSNQMVKDLEQIGCPSDKIILNTYSPQDLFFSARPDYNSNNLVLVGRQTYKKAPYISILAFMRLLDSHPELKLQIIGDGELLEVSENLVKSLNIQDAVTFHGLKNSSEIKAVMENSFLYIQHSVRAANGDSEGTPVGILEAMAAGLPVVSTRHAGIKDAVAENETGLLVDELDLDGMIKAVEVFVKDRRMAEQFGNSGRSRIKEVFTQEKHIGTIQTLIDSI